MVMEIIDLTNINSGDAPKSGTAPGASGGTSLLNSNDDRFDLLKMRMLP